MLLSYFEAELEKIAGTATKTNPALWEKSKAEAKAKMGGKHSARAMQLATQIYKKKGGGYSGAKPTAKNNSLKKWGKQKWQWSKEKKAAGKGVYLPAAKIARLKSSLKGRKKLRSAERKKAIATSRGEQYSSHGLAANTSLKKTAMNKKSLNKIIGQLRKSVVTHGKQADTLSKMVKKASVRDDIMAAFKAEGGALGTKALMKRTKKYSPAVVMQEIKALKSEGKIKQHVHGDMYTPMSKEASKMRAFLSPMKSQNAETRYRAEYRMLNDMVHGGKLFGQFRSPAKGRVSMKEYVARRKRGMTPEKALEKRASIEYRGKTFPGYGKPIASDRKNKKKMVLVKKGDKVKVVHFGQKGYQDFTQHKDKKRRKNYLTRSAGIKNKNGKLTKNDPFSPNYWARRELW